MTELREGGSDAMLAELADTSDLDAALQKQEAAARAEEARVVAEEPEDDPGDDYPAPAPPEDTGDLGGFDPLP